MKTLSTRPRPCLTVLLVLALTFATTASAQVPTPESFFGFRMGTDGQLAGWPDILRYFETVGKTSDRVRILEMGTTTEGRRMIAAIVTAPENIAKLEAIREANQKLSDPRGLTEEQAREIASTQKVVVAIGCSIHASEIAATQTANELLYELATGTDARTAAILRDVVLVLLPSLNPDGHTIVIDWYRRYRGTPFEGQMPWLYQKYAGHDINRDAFMMNLAENRNIARLFYSLWHPQVFLTMHQMGSRGPRLFVPPNYDPIDPNYDPLIWREAGLLGGAMAFELQGRGRSGVISNAMYDYFWPGYEDSAPLGHNTVCLLTEAASARLASPITVEAKDLSGTPKGLPAYAPQTNFPDPWPGGTWHLRDIVDYELDAARGLLVAASYYRQQLVENFFAMGKRAVDRGGAGSPFAFVIPTEQRDPWAAARLVNLLIDGGVEVHEAKEPFRVGENAYPSGTEVILMAQPYRAYAKTLLERQNYPVRRVYQGGPPERPYDVAGWTLPYQMGVDVVGAGEAFDVPMLARLERARIPSAPLWGEGRPSHFLIDAGGTAGALAANRLLAASLSPSFALSPVEVDGYRFPAGSLVVESSRAARTAVEAIANELGLRVDGVKGGKVPPRLLPLARARVGVYKPWTANIDEGWTRLVLEQYGFPFKSLSDADVRRGGLRAQLDVVILPSASAQQLIAGNKPESLPPEYTGGLGSEGVAALTAFVEEGGTLVCLDSSASLAIDMLKLPVTNVLRELTPGQFFCPGSLVRLELDPNQPLSSGMPSETAAFFSFGSAYEIAKAAPEAAGGAKGSQPAISVVGRYAAKNVLMSGWLEGEAAIAGRPAVIEARVGRGRAVLIGFRCQHRGQSLATFRLLFNAILTASR
jgi:Zinc carboxypeptidase